MSLFEPLSVNSCLTLFSEDKRDGADDGSRAKTPEDLAKGGVDLGTDSKGNKNVGKDGGEKKAREDYDSLKPKKERDIVGPNGEKGEVGTLPDGRKATFRPWSSSRSDNVPTVEIGPAPGYKYRY